MYIYLYSIRKKEDRKNAQHIIKQIKADWLWTSVLFACYLSFLVTEKNNKKAKKKEEV